MIYGNAWVRIDRVIQGVHSSWGSRGNAPPPAPAGTREAWPQGVGWLHASIGGFRPVAGRQRLLFNCPHVDTPAGSAIEGTARTSYEALPAPVPGRVRTMSSPEWFARSR